MREALSRARDVIDPGEVRGHMRGRRTGRARSRCACADPPRHLTREVALLHALLSGIAMAATIITNMRMVLRAGSNVAFKMVAGSKLQVSGGGIVCGDACDVASTNDRAGRGGGAGSASSIVIDFTLNLFRDRAMPRYLHNYVVAT